jgi:hypothetical protein
MGAMFEKGQTKRYSRVSTGMSGGGEAKAKKRSKDDDKSEAAEANPYGSTKALDEATKNMRKGGMTKKYAVGGATRKAGGTVKGYSGGGRVASRADGCAARGRTRGTIV